MRKSAMFTSVRKIPPIRVAAQREVTMAADMHRMIIHIRVRVRFAVIEKIGTTLQSSLLERASSHTVQMHLDTPTLISLSSAKVTSTTQPCTLFFCALQCAAKTDVNVRIQIRSSFRFRPTRLVILWLSCFAVSSSLRFASFCFV